MGYMVNLLIKPGMTDDDIRRVASHHAAYPEFIQAICRNCGAYTINPKCIGSCGAEVVESCQECTPIGTA